MHIPPYHKKPSWQIFIVGCAFGGIIAYMVLLYMYGSMYETLLEENLQQESKINDLERQNEALLQDKEDLNEKANEPATVESIEVEITNGKSLRLDRLITHQLEEMVKEEINHLIGEEISIVSKNDRLLISTIENKGFRIEEFTYYFDITRLIITEQIKITVEAKFD